MSLLAIFLLEKQHSLWPRKLLDGRLYLFLGSANKCWENTAGVGRVRAHTDWWKGSNCTQAHHPHADGLVRPCIVLPLWGAFFCSMDHSCVANMGEDHSAVRVEGWSFNGKLGEHNSAGMGLPACSHCPTHHSLCNVWKGLDFWTVNLLLWAPWRKI